MSITPRGLNVTADAKTKLAGQADPPLTYQVIGLQFSDTVSGVLTGSLVRDAGEIAGAYAIRQGTLVAFTNYSLQFTGSTLTIVNTPPTVTIATPVDGVFNVSSVFAFTATDLDAADQNGLFTYSIQWGDGTTSTVVGPRNITVPKTYTRVSSSGAFTISAQATDARGATGPIVTAPFVVLGWTLMPDPVAANKAILVVVGSQGSDNIKIKRKDDDYFRLTILDRDDDVRRRGTVFGDVSRILYSLSLATTK